MPAQINICSIEGCAQRAWARSLCQSHYSKWWHSTPRELHPPRPGPQPKRSCSVKDCEKTAEKLGLCAMHHRRLKMHGDVNYVTPRSAYKPRPEPIIRPPSQRFWKHVDKDGPLPIIRPALGPCWLWTAANTKGYGAFNRGNGITVPAHHWAYEQLIGPIPQGLELDHLCEVHSCVRPSHLEPVTRRENNLRFWANHPDHRPRGK